MKTAIILFLSIIFFGSCTDIIELDLKESEPRIVIEAILDATDSTCAVTVTKSNAFYDTTAIEGVTGMEVVLTKNGENPVLLSEISDGKYLAENVIANPHDDFIISVTDRESITYTASASTPSAPSPFFVMFNSFGNNRVDYDSLGNEIHYLFGLAYWFDVPDEENYYRFKLFKKGEYIADFYSFADDKSAVGDTMQAPLSLFTENDTLTFQLLSINKETYDYFLELQEVIYAGSNSTTPFNPQGNFDNNALGYFCIQQVIEENFVVIEFPFF